MPNETCIFCAIIAGRAPAAIIHQDAHNIAFLPQEQEAFGHTLLVPKRPVETLPQMRQSELVRYLAFVKSFAKLCQTQLNSTDFNLLLASGKHAEQSIPHIHFHYFPRHEGDALQTWPVLPKVSVKRRSEFLALFVSE